MVLVRLDEGTCTAYPTNVRIPEIPPMSVTATQLRNNVYKILDEVLESGTPQEVLRHGRKLLIVSAGPPDRRLDNLPKNQFRNCSFDELVATSWEDSWNAE